MVGGNQQEEDGPVLGGRSLIQNLRDFLPQPYVLIDRGGRIVSVNRAFCAFFDAENGSAEGGELTSLPGWSADGRSVEALLRLARHRMGEIVRAKVALEIKGRGRQPTEVAAFSVPGGAVVLIVSAGAPAEQPGQTAAPQDETSQAEVIRQLRDDISIVRSIIAFEPSDVVGAEAFKATVLQRIDALIGVLDLLLMRKQEVAHLDMIVETVFDVLGWERRRLKLHGPEVRLSLSDSMAFGLLLHDIAGFFVRRARGEHGRAISVDWRRASTGRHREALRLSMRGVLGPGAPTFDETAFARQLTAEALGGTLAFEISGWSVECVLETPLRWEMKILD
ncbi:MAG: PAS domain-containing protein [Pseudomonadota bacterium]